MDLRLFPFDTQICTLEVESYGYSMDDIRLHWLADGQSPVKIYENLKLPTFTMDDMIIEETTQILSTGNYSRLSCKFKFLRSVQYYWIQIYQPSIFVVATSWVSFWINRESAPARVGLGITTILTMTTLMSSTNEQMPKVSYIKAVDIYLVTCYIMVFGALLEYALIAYLVAKEKLKERKNHRQSSLKKMTDIETAMHAGMYYDWNFSEAQTSQLTPAPSMRLRNRKGVMTMSDAAKASNRRVSQNVPTVNSANVSDSKDQNSSKQNNKFRSSDVDKYSRIMFPVIFLLFNVVYWLAFVNIGSSSS